MLHPNLNLNKNQNPKADKAAPSRPTEDSWLGCCRDDEAGGRRALPPARRGGGPGGSCAGQEPGPGAAALGGAAGHQVRPHRGPAWGLREAATGYDVS